MIAKTKFQLQIVSLSDQIPALTPKQVSWAHKKCLPHFGTSTKTGKIACLDCGHKWSASSKPEKMKFKTDCPSCGTRINVTVTNRQKFKELSWFSIIYAIKGYQTIRNYQVEAYYKAGKPADKYNKPISQLFLGPNGKKAVVGRVTSYHPAVGYLWGGTMELRHDGMVEKHNFMPDYIYPYKSIIPELKRAGVKGSFHGHTPLSLYHRILISPKIETLIKAGQSALIQTGKWNDIENLWDSIKICMRNNYTITDGISWIDYINLLQLFGKDTRSPKYVCPMDLRKEHDRYVKKKVAYDKARKLEELRSEIQKDQKQYVIDKKNFLGLSITKGQISVSVMNSVQEVMEAGVEHKHCVFANKYHRSKDSLLLAAKIKGELIETVELSLKTMKIVQSHGFKNQPTKYTTSIKKLVYDNITEFQKRARAV
ncbi:PcfJ domain-containing protein [Parapedobacter sp. 10938]|uniref:PcfJ domain-containing protein n=1 Tax=Parapedobacter flavus TaxID=3110225 RepID=UPI002DB606E0|nr:PcfJ domain-containing protein [Parapedobacter sp. 10938]MEC3881992.1 PcfJ domain-containing protein [Parapedobacter sp. 10938]